MSYYGGQRSSYVTFEDMQQPWTVLTPQRAHEVVFDYDYADRASVEAFRHYCTTVAELKDARGGDNGDRTGSRPA